MNNQRRKRIAAIIAPIEVLQAFSLADQISELESVRDEEQDYFDNMPESLQGGEKGGNAEHAISQMEEALDLMQAIEDAMAELESIVTALDGAKA